MTWCVGSLGTSAHESRSHSVGVSHLSLSALSLKHLCGYRHNCEPRGRLATCGHGALFWCLSLMVKTSTPSQPPVTPVPHAADACLGIQDTSSGETPCELPNHRHTPTGWTGGSPRETVKSSAVLTAGELCLRSFASFQKRFTSHTQRCAPRTSLMLLPCELRGNVRVHMFKTR